MSEQAQQGQGPAATTPTEAAALVVVGGGPAGLEAVRAYRDHGGQGRVVLLSADDHPPYLRPPLTKEYLRGEAGEEDLPLEEDDFYRRRDIEVRLREEVVSLDPATRTLRTASGGTLTYDVCVLATGSRPAPLPVDGADHPDVLLLRWRDDGDRLRRRAEESRSAVVVGSGFIGCEAASSLARRGLAVTMVSTEDEPQQQRLGAEAAARLRSWLAEDGVEVRGGAEVAAIRDGRAVRLADGEEVGADLVLLAVGVRQDQDWLEGAGLRCQDGRVEVDQHMRTSQDRVLAAGDVTRAHNPSAGRALAVEHWGDAVRMGEVAGTTAAGADDAWTEPPGFWCDIGGRMLKYYAWGDGYDDLRFVDHGEGAFTVWYATDGVVVGVLTHGADEDYERGGRLVQEGARLSSV